MNQRRREDTETVYFYRASLPAARRITWEHTDELLFCMEAGRTEEVRQWVGRLFLFYRSLPAVTLGDAKYSCYNMVDQVKYMMNYSVPALQMSHAEA
ncbi:MAG TPA: hypothetical protein DF613_02660, partial [Lachnospiraceae bacterium]|nr:hypothetical protein [Lachnospiraceae bacterium]